MNAQAVRVAFAKELRLFFITLMASFGIVASVGPAWAGTPVSIIDTLGVIPTFGPVTPATKFSGGGTGGITIAGFQSIGPEFTLTQPTILTEIGGFVHNCIQLTSEGVLTPQCVDPTTLPFIVEIRPSTNGFPDPFTVLASFVLSHDNDPNVISYESVAINLPLEPGSYFALFASQGDDVGYLLHAATIPILGGTSSVQYLAGTFDNFGILNPSTGDVLGGPGARGAVRILGEVEIDECPNSDLRATVIIDACDSGVTNTSFPNGCTISDLVAACAEGADNHGQFASCVSHMTNDLKKAGTITGQQKGAIQRCAGQADTP